MPRAKTALSTALAALVLLYPLLVYLGLAHLDARLLGLLLVLVAGLRLLLARGAWRWNILILTLAALLIAALALAFDDPRFLLYYPVCVNLALLVLFGASLIWPPTIVERIVRAQQGDLPARAIGYTRQVTLVWCVFFAVNGAIALLTVLALSLEAWVLYNGLIAYLLMGALLAGEPLVRRQVMRRSGA